MQEVDDDVFRDFLRGDFSSSAPVGSQSNSFNLDPDLLSDATTPLSAVTTPLSAEKPRLSAKKVYLGT
jgi:hypothetical protein